MNKITIVLLILLWSTLNIFGAQNDSIHDILLPEYETKKASDSASTNNELLSPESLQQQRDSVRIATTGDSLHTDTALQTIDILQKTPTPPPDQQRDTNGVSTNPEIAPTPDTLSGSKKKGKRREENRQQLYDGVSRDQDQLASQIVRLTYESDWDDVSRLMQKLEKLEKKHSLPPISLLLQVSIRVYRLENNEFTDSTQRDSLEHELQRYASSAMKNPLISSDYHLPIHELIYCGIKGFLASRKIELHPVEAAIQGFSVMLRLEKLIASDSLMYDAYLGVGLFYCALAKAPSFVKGALALTGRQITLEKGLSYLRIAATKGRYVVEPSQMYLVSFLSPYIGDEAHEKDSIFELLQQRCPSNPRYLFMQIDENICFHPEIFTPTYNEQLRKKITNQRTPSLPLKYYQELIKYQYCTYIDTCKCAFRFDPDVHLREFSFYPLFLQKLREKELCRIHAATQKKLINNDCVRIGKNAIAITEITTMEKTRRDFYNWHIRDALKLR